jgi:hypothetical protein
LRDGSRADFVLRDDLLYFRGKPGSQPDRLYIPTGPFRASLLAEAHDIPISGHLGRTKTLERLSRAFYWPRIKGKVRQFYSRGSNAWPQRASDLPGAGVPASPLLVIDRGYQRGTNPPVDSMTH